MSGGGGSADAGAAEAAPRLGIAFGRNVRLVIVLVLLTATTVAFVVAERLKVEKAPLTATRVTKTFAPTCDCATRGATISFVLRRRDRLTVELVDGDGRRVRRLVSDEPRRPGRQTFVWNGRDDAGAIVPEGRYRPRVELRLIGRRITMPNPILLDVTPPRIRLVSARPTTISPDGDGRRDKIAVSYRQTERGRPVLLVDGHVRVRSYWARRTGTLYWYGRIGGRPVRPGTYRLTLTTRDVAGNRARNRVVFRLKVRYVEVAPAAVRVRPDAIFHVAVATDASSYRWRLGKRTGVASGPVLRLRAPQRRGLFRLVVSERGFSDVTRVLVRGPGRRPATPAAG